MGADGEVFGVLEEALAGGILPQAVGEAGHGVAPAPVDGEGAHAVEGRGFAIDGAGGRPGGAPGELVLADLIRGQRGGPVRPRGSNGYRSRGWKTALERLANDVGLRIHVSHVPPGTSKWNKVEHRLFCHIAQNWRGRPLRTFETVVALIGGVVA